MIVVVVVIMRIDPCGDLSNWIRIYPCWNCSWFSRWFPIFSKFHINFIRSSKWKIWRASKPALIIMWWNLGNWIRIDPSWYLIIVLVNPWLDLWFWVRINPTWDLLIMWWHLWCFIWIDPWLDLGYGVRVYPCWNLGWLNICLFLVIVSWSLVIVCWSLVRSRSLIVVVASGSCLLISIPFILIFFVSSFFT